MRLLFVGDEVQGRPVLRPGLNGRGFATELARSPAEVATALASGTFAAVVLDWELSGDAAEPVWATVGTTAHPVVVLTHDVGAVARFNRRRSTLCLVKPFPLDALDTAVRSVTGATTAPAPWRSADPPVDGGAAPLGSRNPVMNRLLQLAWRAAETDATMLLLGESGTGKSALAREVHGRSPRRLAPFVTVHCPCLHPQLLESQLFGHARGAFTGAVSDRVGRAAAADHGTLFLDEVGDLPLELQPKLLRLLQDREFEPVGDHRTRRVNIRVIAATHRNLPEEVRAGRFREDLFYRLNVVALRVVPLRRRPEDILPCARSFLAQLSTTGLRVRGPRELSPAAQALLQHHSWPGNLRELRNTIERAAILSRGSLIEPADLLLDAPGARTPVPVVGDMVSLAELERAHIREVLSRVGNHRQAARILGINKSTLYRKLRETGDPVTACAA